MLTTPNTPNISQDRVKLNELAENFFANKEWRDAQNNASGLSRNLTVKEMWERACEAAANSLKN